MARTPNYNFVKRQKELEKKRRQEEKQRRKEERAEHTPDLPASAEIHEPPTISPE